MAQDRANMRSKFRQCRSCHFMPNSVDPVSEWLRHMAYVRAAIPDIPPACFRHWRRQAPVPKTRFTLCHIKCLKIRIVLFPQLTASSLGHPLGFRAAALIVCRGGRGVQRGLGGESKLPPVPLDSAERVPSCDFRHFACLFPPPAAAGSRFRETRIVALGAPCDSRHSACLFPPLAAAGSSHQTSSSLRTESSTFESGQHEATA